MAEHENNVPETQGTSRRALLAKAAAAGAVVYAAPVVSSIPAYAAGGLPSFNYSSGTLCVWFSPNQNSRRGRWHADVLPLSGESADTLVGVAPTMTVGLELNSILREVRFSGNPNNTDEVSGANDDGNPTTDPYVFRGGGCRIESLHANCWVEIQHLVCNPQSGWDDPATTEKTKVCQPTNDNLPPASWSDGSSLSPIDQALPGTTPPGGDVGGGTFQDAYYHTGRTGAPDGARCKLGILFRIRCL